MIFIHHSIVVARFKTKTHTQTATQYTHAYATERMCSLRIECVEM